MGSIWMIVWLGSKFFFLISLLFCLLARLKRKLTCDSSRTSDLAKDKEVQGKVWSELAAKLEKIQPGILKNM